MHLAHLILFLCAWVQDPAADEPSAELSAPGQPVAVEAVTDDRLIEERLRGILASTERYVGVDVDVRNGVAIVRGEVDDEGERAWIVELLQRTEGIVAVSDRTTLVEPAMWDLAPAVDELERLWMVFLTSLPRLGVGLVVLLVFAFVARRIARLVSRPFEKRIDSELLQAVVGKGVLALVWVFGLYLFLRLSGLTQIAMTIVGGTGVLGIVLGFAFRDIAENFLASILISIQRPFRYGDTIEVDGHTGVVQRVTPRGTILMDFEGNYIQLANSNVYKSTIKNFTANPNVRQDFLIGIGYDASVTHAQEVVMAVLSGHSAVLQDPKPMVLVEQLASATINLRVYFWVDGHKHSKAKVRSALMRQSLRALEQEGVSLPDDAREVIFPQGVPVRMVEARSAGGVLDEPEAKQPAPDAPTAAESAEHRAEDRSDEVNEAEGDLESEVADINEQARASRSPEEGTDILPS